MNRAAAGVALCLLAGLAAGQACAGDSVAQRRAKVSEAAAQGVAGVPALRKAMADESPLVRRLAARLLADMGQPAQAAMLEALDNPDVVVRRTALAALAGQAKGTLPPWLEKCLKDKDGSVRVEAVKLLIDAQPRTEKMTAMLRAAQKDEEPEVRALAAAALWPFHRDVVLLRDRPDMADHVTRVVVEKSIPLPNDGWRFKADPALDGHEQKWFAPELDDKDWKVISIGHWKEPYIGVAWQRVFVDLPAKPDCVAVELKFGAVDEAAWVWVNGQYVGQHDVGPSGWDQEFSLDVTKEVKWGERNQVTVRVFNAAHGGGIWKPVTIEALRIK
ncbi:MAG TPA: HEAT repeat domain-containing protein [Candidatus Brocadiia bacterium]|nr:HEAT repeat domain-containing protein [Candidatus Brocadiia bacterium]